jgi:hypothetical protein
MDVSKKPFKEQPLFKGRTNPERSQDMEKRKALFLVAYEEFGNVRGAVKAVRVGRHTYERWIREDPEFMRAVERAKQAFGEYLEELALERVRNPDKNRGSDVLLLALLNANLPAKFRPQVALSEDSAKDLIIEWRQAARAVRKEEGEKGDGSSPLPVSVEQTLSELLERRKDRPEKEVGDSGEA